ncbi:DUF4071 domain-containing protein [Pyxidicoccus parkwayensis]|uniref:DUF4071 domain-containing protein n=1 Tax=Pyxidicoccus parkwayensis TaxID=2813578 RepID=A0ABX7P415_9BACT|nr:tetratricopeptide repeat protein [Pyxidicoccus parkwaysis]QSQ25170.1 DUF4071 domain-containing protein [Pyxidicoccus parkwaysis]
MSAPTPSRPLCFFAPASASSGAAERPRSALHADVVWRGIRPALVASGLEPLRADEEPGSGLSARHLHERLMVAEFVVEDLTFRDANIADAVGVRRGANLGTTLLICAAKHLSQLPFDPWKMQVIPYDVRDDGSIAPEALTALGATLTERIAAARRGTLQAVPPLAQVVGMGSASPTAHEKADVFLLRMREVSAVTERISDAVALGDTAQAVAQLDAIRAEVLQAPGDVIQLHTVLLALFLGYREKEAYAQMASLYPHLPRELQRTSVVREQLGFANNRLAEAAAKQGNKARSQELRAQALAVVQDIPATERSSETFGILGRIYKGLSDAEAQAGDTAAAQAGLSEAIRMYEEGFELDPRDYYPGVNAVTLRIARGLPEDESELNNLVPVVRFAVRRAPEPNALRPAEAYWQTATRLELACAARDWRDASKHVEALLGLKGEPWMQPWMYGTTLGNLNKQRKARAGEPDTVQKLDEIIHTLEQRTRPA